jgi:acetyl-CoA carboxylase biotin carboxyl carrier protein
VTLTAREIAEITRLLEDSTFDELRLEIDGLKLHLKRGNAASTEPLGGASAASTPAATLAPERPPAPKSPAVDRDVQDVVAPMLGTFYRAPRPGEPPFIEQGSPVDADTIIGIIEVMKLMNTVRAGVRGTVVEILARDGALVEYGEPLLRVRRATEP